MKRGFWVGAVVLCILPRSGAPQSAREPSEQLQRLLQESWEVRLQEDPLLATAVGDRRGLDRLPSMRREDLDRRAAFARTCLERLARIDRSALSPRDRISYDMFGRELKDDLAEHEFGAYRLPITSDWGFHTSFARLPSQVPLQRVADYEAYIARLRAFPRYVDEHVALMREGLATGFSMPRVVLQGYDGTIRAHVVDDPEQSVFYRPFRSFPAGVPASEHQRLRAAAVAAIRGAVVPAYRRFLAFMTDEYTPGARATTAAADLPRGREYYAHRLRSSTTLDMTPDEVHALGLREVARIRAEMEGVVRGVGFAGDLPQFLEHLRSDPRFYAKSPEELLKEAAFLAKKIDGRLPRLFKTLPRLPYGVEAVPADLAPKFTGGRYIEAPVGGTRAGAYWVNTYALDTRPLYVLEALTLHEAVPGHHLQVALQQEQQDLPAFRRVSGLTVFAEGWALYAERLGLEVGFYEDPYSNFGRLTYEMWRACRLVVDTGLHAKGWSRQQVMSYMAENTALSRHEIETETDRYISWPGQALAYKMGELKIRELRAKAEAALGEAFDVRAFHDAVLRNGPVPLSVLETEIDAFILEEKGKRP